MMLVSVTSHSNIEVITAEFCHTRMDGTVSMPMIHADNVHRNIMIMVMVWIPY